MSPTTSLILYNLRSSYNVGAIFRTADAVGIDQIFLIGTTPCPMDKFKKENTKITKTALGAEKTVAWQYFKTLTPVLNKFKKEGVKIIALEQAENSVDYKKVKLPKAWSLVVGEETKGLPKTVLKKCDQIVEIPMHGQKESLNVSVATGVVLFEFLS